MAPGTEQAFKRRFLAAMQEHCVKSETVQVNGERVNLYQGIKLNAKAQKHVDSIETFDGDVY